MLLSRNVEHYAYYAGLEKALGLDREKAEDREKILKEYKTYADKSERFDAPRRLPLDLLEGDAFRDHAAEYLRRMFRKGVPSTFANLKQLYTDPAKKDTIRSVAEKLLSEEPQMNGSAEKAEKVETNGNADGTPKIPKRDPTTDWMLSINYFLAQHHDYHLSRDVVKARQYIDKAIELNPTKNDYTFHMTRARILKHQGAPEGASKAMNEAREMDLKDRYINTKCALYQLRNQEHETAVDTMGLFTRKEAVGGPLGDLTDMQCVWFLTEDGESYLRQGKYNLALKRFTTVQNIFETWYDDQFDFHSFSLRKGMVRAYVDMIRWEDKLREHPFFTRAALSAIKIYCLLHDQPKLADGSQMNGSSDQSSAEKKKAAKKARKDAEKAEAEKKAQKAKQPQPKADDEGGAKKEDPDPLGMELIKTEKPLEEAMKFAAPLLELSPKNVDGQVAGFEVHIRRSESTNVCGGYGKHDANRLLGKHLPALRCLLAIQKIAPEHPKCHELSCRLRLTLDSLPEPLPEKVQAAVKKTFLSKQPTKSVQDSNEEYLKEHKDSAPHVQGVIRVRHAVKPGFENAKDLLPTLEAEETTLKQAIDGLRLLEEVSADTGAKEEYRKKAGQRWAEADMFKMA